MLVSWRLSNTMDSSFCVEALEEAFEKYGIPEYFNSDQGAQFTSEEFTEQLKIRGIKISMDTFAFRFQDQLRYLLGAVADARFLLHCVAR